MVTGILSKIFGANKSNTKSDFPQDKEFQNHWSAAFQVLEYMKPGLGQRAGEFIWSGENRQVLLEIDAARKNPAALPDHIKQYTLIRKTEQSIHFLAISFNGTPERLARLAEVKFAQNGKVNHHYGFPRNTAAIIPDHVYTMLDILANAWSNEKYPGLTAQDVLSAAEILGGRGAHLLLYQLGATYHRPVSLPANESLHAYLLNNLPVDEIIAGFRMIDTTQRPKAIQALSAKAAARMGDFEDYFFEQLGAGSAKLREAARKALMLHDHEAITPKIVETLNAGKVAMRSEAAIMAGEIGSPVCLEALKARREIEKTASLISIIDRYLQTDVVSNEDVPEGTYLCANGTHVKIPTFVPLAEDHNPALTEEDRKALVALRKAEDQRNLERYQFAKAEAKKQGRKIRNWEKYEPIPEKNDRIFDWLNTGVAPEGMKLVRNGASNIDFHRDYRRKWVLERFDKLPMKRRIQAVILGPYRFEFSLNKFRLM